MGNQKQQKNINGLLSHAEYKKSNSFRKNYELIGAIPALKAPEKGVLATICRNIPTPIWYIAELFNIIIYQKVTTLEIVNCRRRIIERWFVTDAEGHMGRAVIKDSMSTHGPLRYNRTSVKIMYEVCVSYLNETENIKIIQEYCYQGDDGVKKFGERYQELRELFKHELNYLDDVEHRNNKEEYADTHANPYEGITAMSVSKVIKGKADGKFTEHINSDTGNGCAI